VRHCGGYGVVQQWSLTLEVFFFFSLFTAVADLIVSDKDRDL